MYWIPLWGGAWDSMRKIITTINNSNNNKNTNTSKVILVISQVGNVKSSLCQVLSSSSGKDALCWRMSSLGKRAEWLPFSSCKVLSLGCTVKLRGGQRCSSKARATKPSVSPAGELEEQILKLQPRPAESWSLGMEHRDPSFSETTQMTTSTRQVWEPQVCDWQDMGCFDMWVP